MCRYLAHVNYCHRLRRVVRAKLGVNTWRIARFYVRHLTWLPSARHTQTWQWARALFSWQKLLEILVSMIWWLISKLHLLRGSKVELDQTQRTLPAHQWLPICALRKDSTHPFSSTGHLLENHCQAPRRQTTIFSAILRGALDRADDAWTPLQIWLTFYSRFWDN